MIKRKPQFGKLGKSLNKSKLKSSLSSVGAMRPGAIPLAIEFGVSGIKVLGLSGTNPSSIQLAAFLPTPDDLLDIPAKRLLFQMDALPKFLKGEKITATRAMSLIPSGQMMCKHLQIIPTDGVPIEQIAGAQLSTQLGCDPSELLIRCHPVNGAQANSKLEVICFAASREFVGRIMGSLKSAKLEPVGIHTEFDALACMMDLRDNSANSEGDAKASLILDLGCGSTKVLIMHGNEMVFARTIEMGSRHFDETICHQLRCTMIEARQIRSELETLVPVKAGASPEGNADSMGMASMPPPPGLESEKNLGGTLTQDSTPGEGNEHQSKTKGLGRGPSVDLSEPLEIMCDEVSICLRYHNALFPTKRVDRVVFVGGQSRHQPVCEHLARALKLEAQVLDPMACLGRTGRVPTSGVDLRSPQPGWASIVGGALSPMDL